MIRPVQPEVIHTTMTLAVTLIQCSQQVVDKGAELERQEIDRQFAAMADDVEYQALNEQMVEAFDASDWQALTLAEKL